MTNAAKMRIADTISRDIGNRDAEILRLWEAKWSAKKIADYLDIKAYIVGNVVHKNGRARNPRGPRLIAVSLQDAPIEAWQQAMLPKFEQGADDIGVPDAVKRAFVFACLLWTKKYDNLTDFAEWARRVTGYDANEIAAFIERGTCNHLIVNGQPNEEAFRNTEIDETGGDFALMLIAGVFEGTFERTVDNRYSLAGMPLHMDNSRWEDDGGYSEAGNAHDHIRSRG